MNTLVFKIFLSIFLLLSSNLILASSGLQQLSLTEFSHVPVNHGQQNYHQYLNDLGLQRLRLISRSNNNNDSHWVEVVDRKGRVLKRFSDRYSVSIKGEGRYRDKAMLLVSSRIKKCEKNCSRYYLFGSNNRSPDLSEIELGNIQDTLVLKNDEWMVMNRSGLNFLYHDGKGTRIRKMNAPFEIVDGVFGSDIDGNWQAIAVSNEGMIMIANKNGWDVLNITLASHGDRNGVLAIYPRAHDKALIAIYRYTNEYNKGLFLLDYNLSTRAILNQGWLFNSEDINIGFDPEIYVNHSTDEVIVSSINSSMNNRPVFFTLSAENMTELKPDLPEHIRLSGFSREKIGSFMIGGGISQLGWIANSRVEKNDVTYSEVDYHIADSLFISANIEARLGNTSFTLNYLKNEAENFVGREIDEAVNNDGVAFLAKEASSYLFSTIDFHGLLSTTSSLRLQLERGDTKGVAEVEIFNQEKTFTTFSTRYDRIALLSIQERGFYMGGDYVNYAMPSAVGFSDYTGNIDVADFDPDFEFSSLRFVFGYDALAYAKRYETNYSRWYWAGGLNIGLGWASLSDQIIDDAKQLSGKSRVAELPLFFSVGGELELGYIWQKRSKNMGGLGYSAAFGYRLNGNYLGAGSGDEVSIDDFDTLALEFSRYDLFHGPFFKANILF